MTFKDFTQYVIFVAACIYLHNEIKRIQAAKAPITTPNQITATDDDDEDEGDTLSRNYKRRGNRVL